VVGGWRRDDFIFGAAWRKLKKNPWRLETFSMEVGEVIGVSEEE
jgi:hypothetical protein